MRVQDNIVKDAGRVIFWYPIRWVMRLLPFRLAGFMGGIIGLFEYHLFRGRSEKIRRNLHRTFGDRLTGQRSREIVKKILCNHYILILEFVKYPQINERNMGSIVAIEGIYHLDKALAQNRGAIIANCHFGAKLLLIMTLGLKKYPINQIAYHMSKDQLTYIQEKVSLKQRLKIETGFDVTYLYINNPMRRCFTCLEDNEVLLVAIDGKGELIEPFRGAINVKFLDQKVYFPTGIATLSKRKMTPVLPAAVFRKPDGTYKVVIRQPVEIDYEKGNRQFTKDLIEKLAAVFEKDIMAYPDQWEYWEKFRPRKVQCGHEKWKNRNGLNL